MVVPVMFVVGNSRKARIPRKHQCRNLEGGSQQFRTGPRHSALKVKC